MRPLDQLGFVPRAAESAKALNSFLQHTSLSIPESYIQSLGFMPPNGRMFGFKFRREKGGEEWEGQVERFYDYGSQPTLLENSILRPGDRRLLPIATDAGGNELFLDLHSPGQPVIDQDYQTGQLCTIAPSFEAFIDGLYDVD